jgi:hypothetical protein
MKDFLIQCLKDLESLTGIRQLYFLQSDLEDGERKKNVLINGMLSACKEFDYIPEEAQKKIIASQMIQDQSYEALNSRTIWKWLNAFKGPYLNPAKLQDEPVIFEPLKPETEKLVREWQMSLLDNPKPTNVDLEMAKIKAEDAARLAGLETKPKSLSVAYKPKPKDPREEKIRAYLAEKKGKDWIGARTFEMDGLIFRCDDEEDGYNTFVEALK